MVVVVPLAAWLIVKTLDWALAPNAHGQPGLVGSAIDVTAGVLVFLALSPLFSWIGLLVGIPLTIVALQAGLAGWLVFATYFAVAALAINVVLTWGELDMVAPKWLAFAACAGAIVGTAFWLGLRLAGPRLVAPRPTTGRPATR